MGRKNLPADSGMLFDFGQSRRLSFWMANTHIPLQIAFIDERGRIGQIEQLQPHDAAPVVSRNHYRYAVENNAGWFDRHGLRVGAQVQLPGQQQPQPAMQRNVEEMPLPRN